MKVSFSQCLHWWHLLCFRGELSDSQWRTWSTHHAGLIYFKFCRVCVTSDLSRDRIDVAIACCCFVLGTKKAKHQDKAWRIMLSDRQGLLLVDIAGRACDCSLCLWVWPWVTITWSRNGRQFFHGFATKHLNLLIVFRHSISKRYKTNCWMRLRPVRALRQLFGFTWIKLHCVNEITLTVRSHF